MKTRIGFVSNSSTTSFAIYGCEIPGSKKDKVAQQILDYLKKQPGFDDFCKKHPGMLLDAECESCDLYDLNSALKELCGGMKTIFGQEEEYLYIGKSFELAKDTETAGEFKQNIAKIIKDILGEDKACDFHVEGWYDG